MRLHDAASPLGDLEAAAARVVSRLTGQRVVIQDDNSSQGIPDLRIGYVDRRSAVVEVVADMDQEYGATYSALLRWGRGIPAQISVAGSGRMWWAVLSSGANVKVLQKRLPAVMTQLAETLGDEAPGQLTPLEDITLRTRPEFALLTSLGIAELGSRPLGPGEEAVINLTPPRTYGSDDVSWLQVLEWISSCLNGLKMQDVREKLSQSNADERHVFLAATFTSPWAAYYGLADGLEGLPPQPPALPPEITHLWLWTVPPTGRCLAWFPDRGWFEPQYHWATQ